MRHQQIRNSLSIGISRTCSTVPGTSLGMFRQTASSSSVSAVVNARVRHVRKPAHHHSLKGHQAGTGTASAAARRIVLEYCTKSENSAIGAKGIHNGLLPQHIETNEEQTKKKKRKKKKKKNTTKQYKRQILSDRSKHASVAHVHNEKHSRSLKTRHKSKEKKKEKKRFVFL